MFWSKRFQSEGRIVRIAASLPGQNMVAVRIPARSAVTQSGSASSHQNGSRACRASPRLKRKAGRRGSIMLLETIP